jgi:hypothetical protein
MALFIDTVGGRHGPAPAGTSFMLSDRRTVKWEDDWSGSALTLNESKWW